MESKLQLYNRILSHRDEMSADEVSSASADIQKKALLMEEFRTARRVGLYSPYKNEVRTELLFEDADKNRKELYYPAKAPGHGATAYFRINDLGELRPSNNGKLQPTQKQSKLRDINTLNALVVPGVVFDLGGGRIGFGQGFYDGCLEGFRGVRIALAYEFQIVPKLPISAGGRKVDWIVTEKRIIRVG